jgi:hypothetical protein
MNAELNNLKLYFTERRLRCLSVNAIEKEANIPDKTLSHFLKGRRLLMMLVLKWKTEVSQTKAINGLVWYRKVKNQPK